MSIMLQNIYEQPEVLARLVAPPNLTYYRSLHTLLPRYRRVVMVGMGSSHFAARAASYAWACWAGRSVEVYSAGEFAYFLPQLDKNDLAVLISQSGESYETRQALEQLQEHGVPVWGITNTPGSTLGRLAQQVVDMQAGPEAGSSTKTYTASLMCLLGIAAAGSESLLQELRSLPRFVEALLQDMGGVGTCAAGDAGGVGGVGGVRRLQEALLQTYKVVILGMGPNWATAQEAALILREKTYHHAEGNLASEFRHGPIESINPGDLVVGLVGPATQPRTMTLKHYAAIAQVGGQVLELGGPHSVVSQLADLGISEYTSIIPMVIPFQLVSEAIASFRGYNVDGFRYMKKVTDSY